MRGWLTYLATSLTLPLVDLGTDGYQNNLMTMTNPLYAKRYGSAYSVRLPLPSALARSGLSLIALIIPFPAHVVPKQSDISTRVSNALLVGAILGQISVGAICDRIGRKAAIVTTTVRIPSHAFTLPSSPR